MYNDAIIIYALRCVLIAVVAIAATTVSNGAEPQSSRLDPRQLDTEPAGSPPGQAQDEQRDRGIAGVVLDVLNWITGFFDAPPSGPAARPIQLNEQPQSHDLSNGHRRQANTISFAEMAEWLQRAGRQTDLCSSGCGNTSIPKILFKAACIYLNQKTCCRCKSTG